MATQRTSEKSRRIRRAPGDAEREILDAAESLLAERPFRELGVDDVMARTGMTRSSFYHYFRSLDDVAIALMRRVQGEMVVAASPWLEADEDNDPLTAAARANRGSAGVLSSHGAGRSAKPG